jgi:hypothetical protein
MNIQLIFIAPLLLILYGSEVYEHLTEEQSAKADWSLLLWTEVSNTRFG